MGTVKSDKIVSKATSDQVKIDATATALQEAQARVQIADRAVNKSVKVEHDPTAYEKSFHKLGINLIEVSADDRTFKIDSKVAGYTKLYTMLDPKRIDTLGTDVSGKKPLMILKVDYDLSEIDALAESAIKTPKKTENGVKWYTERHEYRLTEDALNRSAANIPESLIEDGNSRVITLQGGIALNVTISTVSEIDSSKSNGKRKMFCVNVRYTDDSHEMISDYQIQRLMRLINSSRRKQITGEYIQQ